MSETPEETTEEAPSTEEPQNDGGEGTAQQASTIPGRKIINASVVGSVIFAVMDDGATWATDTTGTLWKKLSPGGEPVGLQNQFDAFIKTHSDV